MRTSRWVEAILNGLLVLLVVASLLLSVQVWYPGEALFGPETNEPNLQPQPPSGALQMPEVFRPERILIRHTETNLASIHTGSPAFRQIWPAIQQMLRGIRTSGGAFEVDQIPERITETPWIQLHLPIALMLSEWADLWEWSTPVLRNGSIRVDQLTLSLGEPASIYLSGPLGTNLYLTDLREQDRLVLLAYVERLDPALFAAYRPVELKDLAVTVAPDLLVPVIDHLPAGRVTVAQPNERAEEAHYFPDLSVVRQIDERDARSLTDGQRLLRVTAAGALEYRTADPSTSSVTPEMERSLDLVKEWVGARGGWPQEIVLRRYTRQPGRAKLEFELRLGDPYPIESITGALQVHVSAQRVVYLARNPALAEFAFDQEEQQPIIPPEEAMRRALDHAPQVMAEPVRSMHLTYIIRPTMQEGEPGWGLDPAWVIRVADSRIYVFAAPAGEALPPVVMN